VARRLERRGRVSNGEKGEEKQDALKESGVDGLENATLDAPEVVASLYKGKRRVSWK
jgi:hypothetical protein